MIQDIPSSLTCFPEASPAKGDYVFQSKGDNIALTPWSRAAKVTQPLVKVGETTLFLGAAPDPIWSDTQYLRRLPSAFAAPTVIEQPARQVVGAKACEA